MSQLTYSHDQSQRIQKSVLAMVYEEVDEYIERSLVAGSPDIALGLAENLIVTGHLRGVQLMKLFHDLYEVWSAFKTDDTIEDYVFAKLGVSERKFREYRQIYQYIIKPHPEMAGKNMMGLQGILVAARDGMFDEKDWEELIKAPDASTMFEIRRRVYNGETTNSNRLVITWERDGQIYCRRGDGPIKHVGWLTRDESDDDIASAVGRMTNPDKTGVMRK